MSKPGKDPLTVNELLEVLTALKDEGRGEYPVLLQHVRAGVTFGLPFRVSEGDPADGWVVWVWSVCEC